MVGTLHTVIEVETFLRSAARIMDDAERAEVVDFFATNPQAGDVIPGTGGFRKARIALAERGSARVITYFQTERGVFLLLAYAKNDQGNLTSDQARALSKLIQDLRARRWTTRCSRNWSRASGR